MKSVGFTLAEVLITLGIIGVVAAITMPTLIAKHKEQVTVTKVKKFYSLLSQNYLFAVQEYGTPDGWGITERDAGSSDEEEETYRAENAILIRDRLFKNSKILKTCDNAKDQKACGIADTIYYLAVGKDNQIAGSSAKTASLSLADGSSVLVISNGNGQYRGSGALSKTYANIHIDVNGIKPPNTHGKDVFMFYLTKSNITPTGTQYETANPFQGCSAGGLSCTAWVVINGNMDYLHCPEKLGWDKANSCK